MISQKLQDEGITLKSYEVGEHTTICPACSHTRKKKKDTCLSVKIDADGGAAWFCHHCADSGNIPAFEKKSPWKAPVVPKTPSKSPNMYEWFEKRGISKATVDMAGCYTDTQYFPSVQQEKSCIAVPYRLGGKIVNVKYRTRNKDFVQTKDALRSLYNIDNVTGDELIFVEGEMDVLALMEAGIMHAVTLPDGAAEQAKFKEDDKRFLALRNCVNQVKDIQKIIVATDDDKAGSALKEELFHRFGKDRCWTVQWPEGTKDANAVLEAWGADELKGIIAAAEPVPIDGVYRFRSYEDEIMDLYHGRGPQPVTLGLGEFDNHYKIMPGTVHIVTGIPSHGKSNFLEQIIMNLSKNEGWKTAIFSPEHRPRHYAERLLEKHLKKPFQEGPTPRMSEQEVQEGLKYIHEQFLYINSGEHTPSIDWILERAKFTCLKYGIRGLVIDPYNEIEASRKGNQTETEFVSQMLSKIKVFARQHEIVVWIVAHPAKMQKDSAGEPFVPDLYSISGSAHWFNKCDMGIVVHRNFTEKTSAVHVLKVKESPAWGVNGKVSFWFDASERTYKPSSMDFSNINFPGGAA